MVPVSRERPEDMKLELQDRNGYVGVCSIENSGDCSFAVAAQSPMSPTDCIMILGSYHFKSSTSSLHTNSPGLLLTGLLVPVFKFSWYIPVE